MSGNRSLDEFGDAGSGTDDGPDGDAGGPESAAVAVEDAAAPDDAPSAETVEAEPGDADAVPAADEPAPDAAAERPASTYAWHPDGAECEACGDTVEERWRDGEDLVCAGCKEW